MDEWHKSNTVNPLTITPGSDIEAIWQCKVCEHIWPAIVGNRTRVGSGCPMCARKQREITKAANRKALRELWDING